MLIFLEHLVKKRGDQALPQDLPLATAPKKYFYLETLF